VAKVLVVHASRHGSTSEVAARTAERIRAAGQDVDVRAARDAKGSLQSYELVVVGGALYSGGWHTDAHRFLNRHRDELAQIPVAVFGMGPRRDELESWQQSRSQLDRALAKRDWLHPVAVTIFGGVDPKPKRGQPPRDIRDWQAIDEWADHLVTLAST
jgi:menaquinone-dependent protoporphyrinogen oxidase